MHKHKGERWYINGINSRLWTLTEVHLYVKNSNFVHSVQRLRFHHIRGGGAEAGGHRRHPGDSPRETEGLYLPDPHHQGGTGDLWHQYVPAVYPRPKMFTEITLMYRIALSHRLVDQTIISPVNVLLLYVHQWVTQNLFPCLIWGFFSLPLPGLTYKTRKELHKAARKLIEISSRVLHRPLDGKELAFGYSVVVM